MEWRSGSGFRIGVEGGIQDLGFVIRVEVGFQNDGWGRVSRWVSKSWSGIKIKVGIRFRDRGQGWVSERRSGSGFEMGDKVGFRDLGCISGRGLGSGFGVNVTNAL